MNTLTSQYFAALSPRMNSGTRKTIKHCVNHWVRVIGDAEPSTESIETFRDREINAGRSPATIEKTVYRVRQIMAWHGMDIPPGRKLTQRRPSPDVPTLRQIEAIVSSVPAARWPTRLCEERRRMWWQAWLATACWTGWRLSDLERFSWDHCFDGYVRLVAKKTERTGRSVAIPAPPWLRELLGRIRGWCGGQVFGFRARKQLRRELKLMAKVGRVRYVPPHGFRRFAISIWSQADGVAGQILHGCRLGVMDHYLDPNRHLENFACAVPVPNVFLGREAIDRQAGQEEHLLDWFRRAGQPKRDLLVSMAKEILC